MHTRPAGVVGGGAEIVMVIIELRFLLLYDELTAMYRKRSDLWNNMKVRAESPIR